MQKKNKLESLKDKKFFTIDPSILIAKGERGCYKYWVPVQSHDMYNACSTDWEQVFSACCPPNR